MIDSDDEWIPKKCQGKRRSIAPNACKPLAAPKIVISQFSDSDSEKMAKVNRSSKRLFVLPESTSAFKLNSKLEQNVTSSQLFTSTSVNTRESIVPKNAYDCAYDSLHAKKNLNQLQKRKSVAPGALAVAEEKEANPKLNRRMSISKPSLNKCADAIKSNVERGNLRIDDPTSRKRKSIAPGALAVAEEKEANPKLNRRMSISKPSLNKCADGAKENVPFLKAKSDAIKSNIERGNLRIDDPTSRKRKSIAPKTAFNAVKPLTPIDENTPQERESVAFKNAPVYPLQDERDKFEEEIKSYCGEDPLSVWYRYFKWVEQNFLKGGKDGQIVPLIQRCLRALDSQKQYNNDRRLIEIWLKFASESKTPVKVYNHMFIRKVGCEFAKFFIDWSSQLELEGNIVEASEVLRKGVDCQADPIVELKSYWSKFKARTTPNVMTHSKENFKSPLKNSQTVTELKKAKPHKQSNVVSDSKKPSKPEPKNCQVVPELKKAKPPEQPNAVSDSKQPIKPSLKNCQAVTELKKANLQEERMPEDELPKCLFADDSKANAITNKNSCLPDEHFSYYRQGCYINPRMSVLPLDTKVPEVEQEQNDPPVALFEPLDPMKIPMYDKNKIYAWSGEVSFEELRAADWFRREKIIILESIVAEQAQKIKDLEEKLQVFLKLQSNPQPSTQHSTTSKSQVPAPSLKKSSTVTGIPHDSGSSGKIAEKLQCNPQPSTEHSTTSKSQVLAPSLKEPSTALGIVQYNSGNSGNYVTETQRKCQDMQNNLGSEAVACKPTPKTGNAICLDPFDSDVNSKFLQSLNLPQEYYGSFFTSKEKIKADLKRKDLIRIGDISYLIEDMISEGSYGKVFVAVEQTSCTTTSKSKVALKVSKHVSNWEVYMCVTLHLRLKEFKNPPDVRTSVMKVTSVHKYANAIIFTNELSQKGTLLDLVNKYKTDRSRVPELLAMYITWELLQTVSQMHKCQIIHADIKPDNVLIRDNVSVKDIINSFSINTTLVKLIDFGRAIDLTFFEKGTCFSSTFKKDKCVEMMQKKPWVFQIDWFGLLNCVHVLLFADYIKVVLQDNGRWFIEKKLFRRYDQTIWTPLFDELLNIPTCYQEPNIDLHCSRMMTKLQQNIKDFKF